MKHYFITGTSRGIGKSLAEKIIGNENNVVGFSRTETITHKRYTHVEIDLSDLNAVKNYNFPDLAEAEEVILVNNSGVISEIRRVGKISNHSIIDDYNVNVIAPSVLMNNFIGTYQNYTNKRTILNVSSGAGRHAIDAWATYCATKSALDMFSQTIKEEQEFFNLEHRINIFSVAPGVVDTSMQIQIRKTNKKEFSNVDRFINLKKNNELTSPEIVAEKLLYIINNTNKFKEVILDIRNL